jgi:hypothetical protein
MLEHKCYVYGLQSILPVFYALHFNGWVPDHIAWSPQMALVLMAP